MGGQVGAQVGERRESCMGVRVGKQATNWEEMAAVRERLGE